MTKNFCDFCLYLKFINDNQVGILGNYVDGSTNAAYHEFQSLCDQTHGIFESKPRVYNIYSFSGAQISTKENRKLFLNHSYYARTLKEFHKTPTSVNLHE